ncbi:MAG: alkaline phosphatase family protein, partial [Candidatus Nanohaloarchaea archaeon]
GETWEEHGIVGLKKEDAGGEQLFDRVLHTVPAAVKDRLNTGFTQRLLKRVRPDSTLYRREDLQVDTLFDAVDAAEALNVPVFSPNTYYHRKFIGFELGFGKDTVRRDLEAEHAYRRTETEDAISGDAALVMSHFFYPDTFQHLYPRDEEKRAAMYRRMDDLAGELRDAAEDRFDTVIFMSDHGLPTKDAHNENAFYSCNHALFPDTEPHITDFHDTILHHLDTDDTTGLDI